VAVIVTGTTVAVIAAKAATTTIPIVFDAWAEQQGAGLFAGCGVHRMVAVPLPEGIQCDRDGRGAFLM
jgi:hypothetical protein